MLKQLDQEAIIDMASDEEGNSFGDIDKQLSEGNLVSGEKAYSLYPVTCEMPEDRYETDEKELEKEVEVYLNN